MDKSILVGVAGLVVVAGLITYGNSKRDVMQSGSATESGTVLSGLVTIDGSSTVYPITEAVAEDFQKENKDVKVTVGVSGTGGGFKKFCAGEIDIADASRPIKTTEVQDCAAKNIAFIELPVAFDGLAVVVNPKNTWVDHLTVEELKKMWAPEAQGKILKWSDIRSSWPNRELHLFGPGADSGTFDYFTEVIVGKVDSSRGDFTASEDDNVLVQGIANDELALGFFGVAYYEENKDKLKIVPIDDGKNDNGAGPQIPTYEAVATGIYQPLARPLFVYVSKSATDRPEVDAFMKYYLGHDAALSKEVGYIALPDNVYTNALAKYVKRTIGTGYVDGSQAGVKVEDIVKSN